MGRRKHGLDNDTLVIFTSDNGPSEHARSDLGDRLTSRVGSRVRPSGVADEVDIDN